jgi:hypothetical protein
VIKPKFDFDATLRNLPPVRDGNERAFKLCPGGRSEFPQVRPERIQTLDDALATLRSGGFAVVKLRDARDLTERWSRRLSYDQLG